MDFKIINNKTEDKKINSIIDSLMISIIMSKTSLGGLLEFIYDIKNDKVIDVEIFQNGGNIRQYLNPRWYELCMKLWVQTPKGLGTPNAAVGEGELMFVFISPNITKPKKGDLFINDKIIELKGEGVRIMGDISGKEFRKKTLLISDKYNITPNFSKKNNLPSIEIEKEAHWSYWKRELSKLDNVTKNLFINEYLRCVDSSYEGISEEITNTITIDIIKKEIVKTLFSINIKEGCFDKLVILGNGSNIKIIPKDQNIFNQLLDNNSIIIGSDYFRINQNTTIGWYIS